MDNNNTSLSLIVGLRNNLDYTKTFYDRLRKFYPSVELVFVSYGSTDGTHDWLDGLRDDYVRYYYSEESKTLSDTYNKGVSIARSKLVAYLHNDMIISKGFVEELCTAWKPESVLFYTVVEPPVFSEDMHDWKVIKDFGLDLATLQAEEFFAYSEDRRRQTSLQPFATEDPCFFLCVERQLLLNMGGMDPLFAPMFCEDNDLLLRFRLQQLEMIQVPQALAYHFVSKTSRFSADYADITKKIEENSIANFYRKWRFGPSCKVTKRYDIAAVVLNLEEARLKEVEPYFRKVYVDCDIQSYVEKEQANTLFNLSDRVLPMSDREGHEISLILDFKKISEKDINRLPQLAEILERKIFKKRSFLGTLFFNKRRFKIGHIKFHVEALNSYEHELIQRRIDYI